MSKLPELAHKLITEGKNFAAVATLMPDGLPQISMVWIDSDGELVILTPLRGGLKRRIFAETQGLR